MWRVISCPGSLLVVHVRVFAPIDRRHRPVVVHGEPIDNPGLSLMTVMPESIRLVFMVSLLTVCVRHACWFTILIPRALAGSAQPR